MSKSKDDYIIIDLEMTCEEIRPKGYKPEIIEIGMIFMSPEGDVKRKEQIFVKPKFNNVTKYCTELTGYNKEFLMKNGISLNEACNKMKKMGSKNKTIVAWGTDWEQFTMECEWKAIESPLSKSNLNLSAINSMFLKTTEKVSLELALEYWGIEPSGRLHSGLDDAYNTTMILKKMMEIFPFFKS